MHLRKCICFVALILLCSCGLQNAHTLVTKSEHEISIEYLNDYKDTATIEIREDIRRVLVNVSPVQEDGIYKMKIQLEIDSYSDDILLDAQFPTITYWSFVDIGYYDVNGDSTKDIIIIAEFMTGFGPFGATPFKYSIILESNHDQFILNKELMEDIFDEFLYDLEDISEIIFFLEQEDTGTASVKSQ